MRVFDCLDADGDGQVDTFEVLLTLTLWCCGSWEEKLGLLFRCFDFNCKGGLRFPELALMAPPRGSQCRLVCASSSLSRFCPRAFALCWWCAQAFRSGDARVPLARRLRSAGRRPGVAQAPLGRRSGAARSSRQNEPDRSSFEIAWMTNRGRVHPRDAHLCPEPDDVLHGTRSCDRTSASAPPPLAPPIGPAAEILRSRDP